MAASLLIVDDDEVLLHGLARAAGARGYAVDVARDGAQAWEKLGRGSYSVVVTDLQMPGVAGPELLARIQEGRVSTRVVVITGHASLDAAIDCLRRGAVDFLVKPFPLEQFVESVDRAAASLPPREPEWDRVGAEVGLTRGEATVLRAFYRSGATNQELAQELCLSAYTVKSHLASACRKLGVATRTQLLRRLSPAD